MRLEAPAVELSCRELMKINWIRLPPYGPYAIKILLPTAPCFWPGMASAGNREAVLEAVKQYGDALRHASEELRNDREVVLEAVKQYGSTLQYATSRLSAAY